MTLSHKWVKITFKIIQQIHFKIQFFESRTHLDMFCPSYYITYPPLAPNYSTCLSNGCTNVTRKYHGCVSSFMITKWQETNLSPICTRILYTLKKIKASCVFMIIWVYMSLSISSLSRSLFCVTDTPWTMPAPGGVLA